ncbi:hypothetical protein CAPTEDRAFT_186475 [Capitella teleta]|uniref:Uncharacterized protein n=1 Tax=Capitella teleta TaxID=283909 RepID=R7U5B7_CAPTE|nr:hypothetical protein CAPTEDRAFT_186475 [Capitella teleta]|eukprot:ELT98315.1 hypothetical protein CAPTEDRAFT_186475 [Capitella teleta]
MVDLAQDTDDCKVIHTVQPHSDEEVEARKIGSGFNVNPRRPPSLEPSWQTTERQIESHETLTVSDLEKFHQNKIRRFRLQGINVNNVDIRHYNCLYCPIISISKDDMLTHELDVMWNVHIALPIIKCL